MLACLVGETSISWYETPKTQVPLAWTVMSDFILKKGGGCQQRK